MPMQSNLGPTIRQTIIAQILDVIRNMTDGDPLRPVWQKVYTGDITDIENETTPFVTLNESEELAIEMYGNQTIKELSLIVAFRFKRNKGLDVIDQYKYYLGLLQYALLPLHEDDEQYPFIRDLREDSNSHASLGQDDAQPGGALVLILQYAHARNNPYRRAGDPEP